MQFRDIVVSIMVSVCSVVAEWLDLWLHSPLQADAGFNPQTEMDKRSQEIKTVGGEGCDISLTKCAF